MKSNLEAQPVLSLFEVGGGGRNGRSRPAAGGARGGAKSPGSPRCL